MKHFCLICQQSYTPRLRFRCHLECGHSFCFSCARTWLSQRSTFSCPFCRQSSSFFRRHLRSNHHSFSLSHEFSLKTNYISQLFHSLSIHPSFYYCYMAHLFDSYVLQQISFWYKPMLRFHLHQLYQMLQSLFLDLQQETTLVCITPEEKELVTQIFYRTAHLLQHQIKIHSF